MPSLPPSLYPRAFIARRYRTSAGDARPALLRAMHAAQAAAQNKAASMGTATSRLLEAAAAVAVAMAVAPSRAPSSASPSPFGSAGSQSDLSRRRVPAMSSSMAL